MSRIYNRKYLGDFRKHLRNEMTIAEALLWRSLKQRQLDGRKFRRQHSVGNYILDFYCVSARLAIELDGGIHSEPGVAKYDELRTIYLNGCGIRVIRFDNQDVVDHIEGVLERISQTLSD